MAERLNAAVSKTVTGLIGPTRVRIPPPPLNPGGRPGRLRRLLAPWRTWPCDPAPRISAEDRGAQDAVLPCRHHRDPRRLPSSPPAAERSADEDLITVIPGPARVPSSTVVAARDEVIIDAGGRELRVSSAGPGDLPAHRRGAGAHEARDREVLPGRRGRHHARAAASGRRRWSAGRRASTRGWCSRPARARGAATRSSRSGCRRARPTWVETAHITFPSGRTADEICPTELAVVAWCAQMGTITFHPWPVGATTSTIPTSCASTSTRSRAPTSPTPSRVAGDVARAARRARLRRLAEDLRRARHAHLRAGSSRAGPSPRCATRRSRSAASWSGGCPDRVTTAWWKEERGERDLHRLQPDGPRPHDRLGVLASGQSRGAPVSAPLDLGRAGRRRPGRLRRRDHAGAVRRGRRPARGDRRRAHSASRRCWSWSSADERDGRWATCRIRRTTRRCPASRSGAHRRATGTGRD